jgi:cupin domain
MDDDIRVACPQACNLDRCVAEFSRFLPVSFLSATTLSGFTLLAQLTGEVSPQPFVLSFLVEHFIVLEGRLHIANGDKTLDAPAGKAVTVRKGVPHAWCNLSDTPVRMLLVFSPGHIERLFEEVASRHNDDIWAILDKFGCLIVGPALLEGVYSRC